MRVVTSQADLPSFSPFFFLSLSLCALFSRRRRVQVALPPKNQVLEKWIEEEKEIKISFEYWNSRAQINDQKERQNSIRRTFVPGGTRWNFWKNYEALNGVKTVLLNIKIKISLFTPVCVWDFSPALGAGVTPPPHTHTHKMCGMLQYAHTRMKQKPKDAHVSHTRVDKT